MISPALRATPAPAASDDRVELVGLDFGSTTSRAAKATARLFPDSTSGRVELGEVAITYRSPVVFTPFVEGHIDLDCVARHLDRWLDEAELAKERLIGGGTLITGLAARSKNAPALAALLRTRLGPCVLATAADPCLESWVAFMASCESLSRLHPERYFLNLDIGGGSTNLALGRTGTVLETAALRVGARHIQVRPGSHVITALSDLGSELLAEQGITARIGGSLTASEVAAIVGFQVRILEALVRGDRGFFENSCAQSHLETALVVPRTDAPIAITFTGGVGDLIYRIVQNEPLPDTTAFGDLGIELALAIARSPLLVPRDAAPYLPKERALATVHGMLLHGTQVSGTTLYLPRPQVLPLPDLPILARLCQDSTQEELEAALRLAAHCPQGACIHISEGCATLAEVRALSARCRAALTKLAFPRELPLVFVLRDNTGKLLGHYLTDWGRDAYNLVVLDEVAEREMAFVSIGALREQVVPVSFYGMKR